MQLNFPEQPTAAVSATALSLRCARVRAQRPALGRFSAAEGYGCEKCEYAAMFSAGRWLLDAAFLPLKVARAAVEALDDSFSGGNSAAPVTAPSTRPEPPTEFASEAEMLGPLRDAAVSLWIAPNPDQTWVMLEEQRLHSRIADLLLLRMNVPAIETRVEGGWTRPLTLAELQVLRTLRPDRTASVAAVSQSLRMAPRRTSELLRGLAASGFVERQGTQTFVRVAPVDPLVQRVISFEAKRDDPQRAISQARGHIAWADETYVAFDARFERRFLAQTPSFERLGVGLLELWPNRWSRVRRARPRRTQNRLEAGLVGETALARLTGLAPRDLPERRLPHGSRLPDATEPMIYGPGAAYLRASLSPPTSS